MLLQNATAVKALYFGPHMPKLRYLGKYIFCESSLSSSTLLLSSLLKVKRLMQRPQIMVPKILSPVFKYHMSWTWQRYHDQQQVSPFRKCWVCITSNWFWLGRWKAALRGHLVRGCPLEQGGQIDHVNYSFSRQFMLPLLSMLLHYTTIRHTFLNVQCISFSDPVACLGKIRENKKRYFYCLQPLMGHLKEAQCWYVPPPSRLVTLSYHPCSTTITKN